MIKNWALGIHLILLRRSEMEQAILFAKDKTQIILPSCQTTK